MGITACRITCGLSQYSRELKETWWPTHEVYSKEYTEGSIVTDCGVRKMKKKGNNTVTKTRGMGNRPCMMKHVVREQWMM